MERSEFDTHMNLQSADTILIKYPVQTMFESTIVTIYPHSMLINLEPLSLHQFQ